MHTAKELDNETSYMYFRARYYDSELSGWLSVDPMSDKYPSLSPYCYTADNPVVLVDPNGKKIITLDEESQTNISNSLTKKEARYVKFDKNGVLVTKLLNKCKSKSENITALKALANSEIEYKFQVTDKDHEGKTFYDNNENFYNGVCEIPGSINNPSPDNAVWILVGKHLQPEKAVQTTAHEAYGHAYFYDLQQHGIDVNPYHNYQPVTVESETNGEGIKVIFRDANKALVNQIKIVEMQAKSNYLSRKKNIK